MNVSNRSLNTTAFLLERTRTAVSILPSSAASTARWLIHREINNLMGDACFPEAEKSSCSGLLSMTTCTYNGTPRVSRAIEPPSMQEGGRLAQQMPGDERAQFVYVRNDVRFGASIVHILRRLRQWEACQKPSDILKPPK